MFFFLDLSTRIYKTYKEDVILKGLIFYGQMMLYRDYVDGLPMLPGTNLTYVSPECVKLI